MVLSVLSLLILQCPAQCPSHGRHSINMLNESVEPDLLPLRNHSVEEEKDEEHGWLESALRVTGAPDPTRSVRAEGFLEEALLTPSL